MVHIYTLELLIECITRTLVLALQLFLFLFFIFITPAGLTQLTVAKVLRAFLLLDDASQVFLQLQEDLVRLAPVMLSLCSEEGFRNLQPLPCQSAALFALTSSSPEGTHQVPASQHLS